LHLAPPRCKPFPPFTGDFCLLFLLDFGFFFLTALRLRLGPSQKSNSTQGVLIVHNFPFLGRQAALLSFWTISVPLRHRRDFPRLHLCLALHWGAPCSPPSQTSFPHDDRDCNWFFLKTAHRVFLMSRLSPLLIRFRMIERLRLLADSLRQLNPPPLEFFFGGRLPFFASSRAFRDGP